MPLDRMYLTDIEREELLKTLNFSDLRIVRRINYNTLLYGAKWINRQPTVLYLVWKTNNEIQFKEVKNESTSI